MQPFDVLIVGSGPAGLHAAIELRRRNLSAAILERDADAGGVPRWCAHRTFPCRVKKRLFDGPAYARAWVAEARAAGAGILTATTVLRLDPGGPALETTSPGGRARLEARAVLLATGAREAHRHQRLVPGDRAAGIFTTASLFQSMYLNQEPPGRRVVVFGSEDVSYSCIHAIRKRGGEVAAVVEPAVDTRSFPWLRWYFQRLRGIPHYFGAREFTIHGKAAVERVTLAGGITVECDAVVFTGGFTPNAELARNAGLAFNAATRGPSVSQAYQTSRPGVFAAGNCLRGVVSADEAALEGRQAAAALARYLDGLAPRTAEVPIQLEPPLAYCCPDRLAADAAGMSRLAIWPAQHTGRCELVATQSGAVLWRRRFPSVRPGRRLFIPLTQLRPTGADPLLLRLVPL